MVKSFMPKYIHPHLDSTFAEIFAFTFFALYLRQVVYCADWEDEKTGEIQCKCGIPIEETPATTQPIQSKSAMLAIE